MNIGKGKIQTGMDAQLRKILLQQRILKKPTVMYRYKEFIQEMNVERQEILRKTKLEHTHSWIVSMLKNNCHSVVKFIFCRIMIAS